MIDTDLMWESVSLSSVTNSRLSLAHETRFYLPLACSSSSPADMECGGGELSDSGSSGYWSWDHGNVSPAPSPSVTEMDSSPDEGLHMELEQGEELAAKKPKVHSCSGKTEEAAIINSLSAVWTCVCARSPSVCALPPAELRQKCVQMPVARLWQSPHVFSWHKKTHPCAASGVSWHFEPFHASTVTLSRDVGTIFLKVD